MPGAPMNSQKDRTGFVAVELEISVRAAFVADIQLVVAEITAEADGVVAHILGEGIAQSISGIGLIKIQPIVSNGKVIEKQGREGRRVSGGSGVDQAASGRIGVESELAVARNFRTGRRLRGSRCGSEELDA